jgi:hypothetical protein
MEILRTGLVSFARDISHWGAADGYSAADRFHDPRKANKCANERSIQHRDHIASVRSAARSREG